MLEERQVDDKTVIKYDVSNSYSGKKRKGNETLWFIICLRIIHTLYYTIVP